MDRKRHFLEVFRRWDALFKRGDRGDIMAEKWLIAEYFKRLGHLSPTGLECLTDLLTEKYTFFPTIAECLAVMKCDRYDYGNPFRNGAAGALSYATQNLTISAPVLRIVSDGESA